MLVDYARTSDFIRDLGQLPPVTLQKSYSIGRTWNENMITPAVLLLIGISTETTVLTAGAEGKDAEGHPVVRTSPRPLVVILKPGKIPMRPDGVVRCMACRQDAVRSPWTSGP